MISSNELKMERKRLDWTETQLAEIMDETDSLKERKQDLQSLLAPTTKSEKKRVKEMIRPTQLNLINENRIGLRRKGSGRLITFDELDEQFLLNCIESKTTAHGRRYDQVMYTGHRVKKKDFLKLVNFNRLQRGLKTIKSATTVYNRGRPQNKRSSQSKRHLGLGLVCTKKPPKMENNENEITHYQRAYKKNVVNFFYNRKDEGLSHVIELSMDDKA